MLCLMFAWFWGAGDAGEGPEGGDDIDIDDWGLDDDK